MSGFVFGAKPTEIQNRIQITPIAYEAQSFAAPANARLRLIYKLGGSVNTPMLEVNMNMHSTGWRSGTLQYWLPDGETDDFDTRRKVSGRRYPWTMNYQNLAVTVLDYDRDTKEIQYQLGGRIERARVRITVTTYQGQPTTYYYE